MLRRQSDPNQGTSIVRFRFALAVMVAGLLLSAGTASAQSTTTEPLSGYTNTSTTETQKGRSHRDVRSGRRGPGGELCRSVGRRSVGSLTTSRSPAASRCC